MHSAIGASVTLLDGFSRCLLFDTCIACCSYTFLFNFHSNLFNFFAFTHVSTHHDTCLDYWTTQCYGIGKQASIKVGNRPSLDPYIPLPNILHVFLLLTRLFTLLSLRCSFAFSPEKISLWWQKFNFSCCKLFRLLTGSLSCSVKACALTAKSVPSNTGVLIS